MSKIPGIGQIDENSGLIKIDQCSDGFYKTGDEGVRQILSTGDNKVEFIIFEDRTIAYVKSLMGYPAFYPVPDVKIDKPIKAVLMDLDGTTVKSEKFWIWIIQLTTASLLGVPEFELEEADISFVSGHSVSEHLTYCIEKYCPDKTVEEARSFYFEHTHREMEAIMQGKGRKEAFTPSAGIKEFLLELKSKGVKLGLVTSGLYEKAYPEILSAFETLGLDKPDDFYDAIITAGFPLRKGSCGTLGELSPKPHPWLYAEVCRVGLGLEFSERHHVVGIEDSSAGIASIRLAGFSAIGIKDGNIIEGGTVGLCNHFCDSFEEILKILF
ncbi:MAG: HAD family hydrolase [Planctomycetota bacterium]|jgi:beta-phosphoglucomutase-like phosphatase (HAD superfamily)